jgi:predicted DCC family thiol-disulfide oxidoreductase YuxK
VDNLIVLYDHACGFCKVMLALLLSWDRANRLRPVPIQSPRGDDLLADIEPEDRLKSWHVVDAQGVLRSGGAGIPVIFKALHMGAPIADIASRFPTAASQTYDWVAAHRALLGRPLGAQPRAWAAQVIAKRSERQVGYSHGEC